MFQKILDHYAPLANELDHNAALLHEAYQALADAGALGLLIPKPYGGLGGGRNEWAAYNIAMAGVSGALLFLQAQHQFAVSRLKLFLPNATIETLFKKVIDQHLGLGFISKAQASRSLQITPNENGWLLNGKLPWVTGWSFYQKLYFTFEFDQTEYHCLLPFETMTGLTGTVKLFKI